jgi:hypothetical protein
VLGLAGAAGVAGIRATPRPTIDDWHILQGSARALLHLHNIYGQPWPGAEGHLLPYLPASAILLAPFYLLLSDVRYGLLAALLVAALLVGRLADRPGRGQPLSQPSSLPVLAGLIVVYPWVLYLVEQSWPEPLLLALLAGMVWATGRQRSLLAVACFTAALVTKQHVFILVPFAAIWPAFGLRRTVSSVVAASAIIGCWLLAGPHQFIDGAIRYNLNLAPRRDSLSLFSTAIRMGHTPSFALVPLLMLVALAVGLWKLPRTATGFTLGSAWLLGVFNLLNKQSFFNEWSLVVGLITLGIATLAVAGDQHREPPSGSV